MIDRYINLLIDRGIIWQGEEEIYKYKLTCFLEKTFTISIMILISLIFRQTIFFLAEKQNGWLSS